MMLEMFAVYDSAVKAFLPPIFVRSRGEATRSFLDACQQEGSNFAKHSSDYTLFYLGKYDDSGAQFVLSSVPERVISALECVANPFTEENRIDDPEPTGAGNGKVRRLPM